MLGLESPEQPLAYRTATYQRNKQFDTRLIVTGPLSAEWPSLTNQMTLEIVMNS